MVVYHLTPQAGKKIGLSEAQLTDAISSMKSEAVKEKLKLVTQEAINAGVGLTTHFSILFLGNLFYFPSKLPNLLN